MMVLGRIVAPFGVRGWVKIHPFGDDPLSWGKMSQWWLSSDDQAAPEQWQPLQLSACRAHGKSVVAAFQDVVDRNRAEALTGYYIAAPREAMPQTGRDEYYWGDLIGLLVVNEQGQTFGKVSGLLSTGVHDVLQITDGEQERLIPFVPTYVPAVDLTSGRITVTWEADW